MREERKETVEISEKRCQESKPLSEGTGILEGRRKEEAASLRQFQWPSGLFPHVLAAAELDPVVHSFYGCGWPGRK